MYLNKMIEKLAISSKEAIASGDQALEEMNRYLHVNRTIEGDLIEILERVSTEVGNRLVIIAGNVGDGKSHLLSFLKETQPELLANFIIHNDATESFNHNQDALVTLKHNVFERLETESNCKIILAINLGVIFNFISTFKETAIEKGFAHFIEESQIFSGYTKQAVQPNKVFSIVSFSDYQLFSIDSGEAKSIFLSQLFTKITEVDEKNPFYIAYKNSKIATRDCQLVDNYEFFSREIVRNNIISLIIQAAVKFKLVISMRQIYQFIYECLDSGETNSSFATNFFYKSTTNTLLSAVRSMDPLKRTTKEQDLAIIEMLQNGKSKYEIKNNQWKAFLNCPIIMNPEIDKYIKYLYAYYGPESGSNSLKKLYLDVKEVLLSWDGKAGNEEMFLDNSANLCRISQEVKLRPKLLLNSDASEHLEYFSLTLALNFEVDGQDVKLYLDYKLYELIMKLQNGYRPNKVDREKAIHLTDCIDKILSIATKKQTKIYFTDEEHQKKYELAIDDFGDFVFGGV